MQLRLIAQRGIDLQRKAERALVKRIEAKRVIAQRAGHAGVRREDSFGSRPAETGDARGEVRPLRSKPVVKLIGNTVKTAQHERVHPAQDLVQAAVIAASGSSLCFRDIAAQASGCEGYLVVREGERLAAEMTAKLIDRLPKARACLILRAIRPKQTDQPLTRRPIWMVCDQSGQCARLACTDTDGN